MRATALLLLLMAHSAAHASPSPNSIADFLIQNICVDAADRPIPGDPATCPRARDMRAYERIPFLRTDNEGGQTYVALTSHPIHAPTELGPNPRVLVLKDFGGDDPGSAFRDFDLCTPETCNVRDRDGYDILEMNAPMAAIVGTSDPGVNDQRFWAQSCGNLGPAPAANEDSWLLFPSSLSKGRKGQVLARLNITTNGRCPSFFNSAFTQWHYRAEPFTYTSGRALETIVSDHYGGGTIAGADHIEVFYFTRAHGFTRWERWQAGGGTPKTRSCNGDAQMEREGTRFVRVDCRDWTRIVPQDVGFLPGIAPIPAALSGAPNLIVNATFAQSRLAPWQDDPTPGALLYFRTGTVAEKNVSLGLACNAPCARGTVFQDIVPDQQFLSRPQLRFGLIARALRAGTAATLTISGFGPNGKGLGGISQSLKLTTRMAAFDFAQKPPPWMAQAARLRLTLSLPGPGTALEFDEAYLILAPD